MDKKEIVILGGGFAGVAAARKLAEVFTWDIKVGITLVNRTRYHEYHADLYEVATSEEEMTSTTDIRGSVLIPLKDIFQKKRVRLVYDDVVGVDLGTHTVELTAHTLHYDYLVYALGSTSCYYNIPGAKEYSLPLKTSQDALRIRNAISFAIERHREDVTKYNLRIVVVGGGFTGVELAAELTNVLNVVAWKNNYPREKIEVVMMEAATRVLNGLPEEVSRQASDRLRDLGVHIYLNSHIVQVDSSLVYLANGERVEYDVLIWTAGVEGASVPITPAVGADRCSRIMVNEYLQTGAVSNAFFIGDAASNGLGDPPTAQYALHHAAYVAQALPILMQNKKPAPYKTKRFPYVVPLGRTFALWVNGSTVRAGFAAYLEKALFTFRYYRTLLGFWPALRLVMRKMNLYSRND